jgi:transcriptional regulator with XRE-family HTH domain
LFNTCASIRGMNDGVSARVRELGEFIREQRRQAQLSLRKLAEQAGVSNPYLSQIERGLRKPSAEILQAIAKALRISAETLYVRAGLLDPEAEATDVVAAILQDRSITEGQKKTLIEIYHSFRIVAGRAAEGGEGDRWGSVGESEEGELKGEAVADLSDELSADGPQQGPQWAGDRAEDKFLRSAER